VKHAAVLPSLLLGLLLGVVSCGKFQQARECGAFVKTVNAWLSAAPTNVDGGAGPGNDPKRIAEESRVTAKRYDELAQSLTSLHVTAEELAPRVRRYEAIANSAASSLREVADLLQRGDLEGARKKRVDFDTVAQQEAPLVKEINDLCR